MNSFPKLSFACPVKWDTLRGDERERFCEQCGHRVSNLSVMSTAERQDLLARAGQERICASFYVRLSGERVTPEKPLTTEERSRVRQLGVAALSAGALALAAGCVAPAKQAKAESTSPSQPAALPSPAKSEEEVIVLRAFGIVAEPTPASTKSSTKP